MLPRCSASRIWSSESSVWSFSIGSGRCGPLVGGWAGGEAGVGGPFGVVGAAVGLQRGEILGMHLGLVAVGQDGDQDGAGGRRQAGDRECHQPAPHARTGARFFARRFGFTPAAAASSRIALSRSAASASRSLIAS